MSVFFSSYLLVSFSCSSLSFIFIAWSDVKAFRSGEVKVHMGNLVT